MQGEHGETAVEEYGHLTDGATSDTAPKSKEPTSKEVW